MSKRSDNTLARRFAQACWILMATILLGYLLFAIFAGADKSDLFGASEHLKFGRWAVFSGIIAQISSLAIFFVGGAGIVANMIKKSNGYLKTFAVSMLLPLLIIPANFVILSLYGF